MAMLTHASLLLTLWGEAFFLGVFFINRFPSRIKSIKSRLKLLFNHKPYYLFLKVFKCLWFPRIRPYNSHKMEPWGVYYTFLVHGPRHKGYKCLSKEGKLYISRNVVF